MLGPSARIGTGGMPTPAPPIAIGAPPAAPPPPAMPPPAPMPPPARHATGATVAEPHRAGHHLPVLDGAVVAGLAGKGQRFLHGGADCAALPRILGPARIHGPRGRRAQGHRPLAAARCAGLATRGGAADELHVAFRRGGGRGVGEQESAGHDGKRILLGGLGDHFGWRRHLGGCGRDARGAPRRSGQGEFTGGLSGRRRPLGISLDHESVHHPLDARRGFRDAERGGQLFLVRDAAFEPHRARLGLHVDAVAGQGPGIAELGGDVRRQILGTPRRRQARRRDDGEQIRGLGNGHGHSLASIPAEPRRHSRPAARRRTLGAVCSSAVGRTEGEFFSDFNGKRCVAGKRGKTRGRRGLPCAERSRRRRSASSGRG